jgi:hypothetical protein
MVLAVGLYDQECPKKKEEEKGKAKTEKKR